jgi:hypothetical protein
VIFSWHYSNAETRQKLALSDNIFMQMKSKIIELFDIHPMDTHFKGTMGAWIYRRRLFIQANNNARLCEGKKMSLYYVSEHE